MHLARPENLRLNRDRTQRQNHRRAGRSIFFIPALLLAFAACGSNADSTIGATANTNSIGTDAGTAGSGNDDASTRGGGSANDGAVASKPDGGTPGQGVDAGPCGMRTGMRDLTARKLSVGGLNRTYLIYLPSTLDPAAPIPFVYVFHGYTMSGQEMHDITQYAALADKEGIALAFPDGEGGANSTDSPWNVENKGQTVCGYGQDATASGDDFAFMDAMKADVAQDQCIDAAHTYATGFSMGGYFTHHIACYRDDIRAVAPHSGGTIPELSDCTTGHVPIIIFHGTADSVITPGCDDPHATTEKGFTASASLWAAKNGCKTTATMVEADGTPTSGSAGKGQCYLYDGCPADGQVELCTFAGMDHCWAGGSSAGAGGDNACPSYASATQLEWSFFKKYAW